VRCANTHILYEISTQKTVTEYHSYRSVGYDVTPKRKGEAGDEDEVTTGIPVRTGVGST